MEKIILELEKRARDLRIKAVEMVYNAKSGHIGGSLSCTDILTVLYHHTMDLSTDENGKRTDKFILSKGHATPIYYATLASVGFLSDENLKGFRNINSKLEGHPSNKINGVDSSSGSLGQGLSIGNGMALAKKIDKKEGNVYVLLGDGEIEEGQVWEALMSTVKFKLNNLCVIIDNNNLQIDGNVIDIKNIQNLDNRLKAFGFNVITIDGHNILEIIEAFNNFKKSSIPTVIIAKTIKSKGVKFMENNADWHGKAPNDEEYNLALEQLKGGK